MTELLIILLVILAVLLGVALGLLYVGVVGKETRAKQKKALIKATPSQVIELINLLRYDGTEQE
ncbi:MAG: hypothetical protein J6B93_00755 [Clostridia bacterium]|nr:hypothetical protein [Clostridia bacterium]